MLALKQIQMLLLVSFERDRHIQPHRCRLRREGWAGAPQSRCRGTRTRDSSMEMAQSQCRACLSTVYKSFLLITVDTEYFLHHYEAGRGVRWNSSFLNRLGVSPGSGGGPGFFRSLQTGRTEVLQVSGRSKALCVLQAGGLRSQPRGEC